MGNQTTAFGNPRGTTVTKTPTVSTSPAYSSGDCVGGIQQLDNVGQNPGDIVILNTIEQIDKGNQKANMTVLFFGRNPTGATTTDNGAFAFASGTNPGNPSDLVGQILIATADYTSTNSIGVANKAYNVALHLPVGGRALWAVFVTTGTPTYATTSDLITKFRFTYPNQ